MPDDDKPRSKYECLVEAASNSGVGDLLPKIKAGTYVGERDALPRPGVPQIDGTTFEYEAENGKRVWVWAADAHQSDDKEKPTERKQFQISESGEKTVIDALTAGQQNLETGQASPPDDAFRKQPKPGTIPETTDKFLKCRDPKMS
ncbi:hypothetical protein [uncultured Bradyrhizobium sp.]|jgi:hypothetical protein|uniref:hypothetical protein n=1 Tax=uncultured Bradyrhizobium sp. TaxID=199684 RepID=UPI00260F44E8|nr:hypothetical protein [uncultured Bradyrhizobium sp.]